MVKMAIVLEPHHWRHNRVHGLVCFADDETIYDPWVEKLVGQTEDGGDVWLYARKRRDGKFTSMVWVHWFDGEQIYHERNDLTSLGEACRDAERWFMDHLLVGDGAS